MPHRRCSLDNAREATIMAARITKNIANGLAASEWTVCKAANGINSRGWAFVAMIGVVYLATFLYRAERKLLWFDEIFTLYISRLHDFPSVLDALKQGIDLNPPLFYVWTRLSMSVFGDGALAIRVPSILGVGLLCLCLYRFVASRSTALGGLIACLFPLTTAASFYAYEGRPHGVVLGFAGLALVCWQSAVDPERGQRRVWWLAGLGISLACAVLTHAYAVALFFPLAIGELVRSVSRRRVDWAVWSTFALAATAVLVPVAMIRVAKMGLPAEFFPASFGMLLKSYQDGLSGGLVFVVCLAVAVLAAQAARAGAQSNPALPGRQPANFELAACLGFVAVPFFVFLLSAAAGTPHLARYGLTCVVGFAAILGFAVAEKRILALAVGALLAAFAATDFVGFYISDHIVEPSSGVRISTYRWRYDKQYELMASASDGASPIVVAGDVLAAPLLQFAPPSLRERLILVYDGDDILGLGYAALKKCCGATGTLAESGAFLAAHQSFFVFTSEGRVFGWLASLLQLGAEISLQGVAGSGAVFKVTLPSRADE
jgi:hypothetical protein